MLYHSPGYLGSIPAPPFRLQQMKSQLMACRWCVCPRPQATTADKFISMFFKNGPVLNPVFIKTRHFGSHFFLHFFITKWSPKKSHDVGIPPKALGQRKVIFFPGTKDESVSAEDVHQKTIHLGSRGCFKSPETCTLASFETPTSMPAGSEPCPKPVVSSRRRHDRIGYVNEETVCIGLCIVDLERCLRSTAVRSESSDLECADHRR